MDLEDEIQVVKKVVRRTAYTALVGSISFIALYLPNSHYSFVRCTQENFCCPIGEVNAGAQDDSLYKVIQKYIDQLPADMMHLYTIDVPTGE